MMSPFIRESVKAEFLRRMAVSHPTLHPGVLAIAAEIAAEMVDEATSRPWYTHGDDREVPIEPTAASRPTIEPIDYVAARMTLAQEQMYRSTGYAIDRPKENGQDPELAELNRRMLGL